MNRTMPSSVRALALAAALTAGLTGCTLPDVTMSPGITHAAARSATAATTTPGAVPAAATSATPRPPGPLDTGSITHSLAAGSRKVVIDYWTTNDARSWRAKDTKSLQLSAHVEGGGNTVGLKVTQCLVIADDGTTRTTALDDRGEFVITPPFSYTTALSLLPSAPSATKLTLYVQFDVLVETAPTSGEYFRQTVLDSLTLPLLQEDPK